MNNNVPTRNLLIDCSNFEEGWVASSSLFIYAVRLIKGFLQYGHSRVHVLIRKEMEERMDKLIGVDYNKIVLDKEDLHSDCKMYYRIFGVLPRKLKVELRERKIRTVLQPTHRHSFLYYHRPYKQFTVIHDLFLYDNVRAWRGRLSYFIWRLYHWMLVRKFPHLITISKASHDELLRRDGRKSQIVHNSFAFDFMIQERTVETVSGKSYILDINRFAPYKNAELLIRALGLLKNRIPHVLYLKGDHSFGDHHQYLARLAKELGLENRVIFDIDYRTEGELRYLYSNADLFVSPSLKEGFGWTPIEAAILKTPVLVSDLEIFKEVTCGKIPTFDPHSPEDLAVHIMEILNNPPTIKERTELAEFFLETYSLKKQIERLEEILT